MPQSKSLSQSIQPWLTWALAASVFFTAVPFGMTAQEMNGWLYYGGGMELWQEVYDGFGLVPMAAGNTGVQMGGWFNKEINSPEDLQGLKMRIPGLGGEVLRRAGGTPVTLPGAEIFTSLQTGAIDATEWVGAYNDVKRVYNTQKLRCGKGKMRNKRYNTRKGPLVVYHTEKAALR